MTWLPLLDLTQNYFSLFDLPPVFDLDGADLAVRYRDIQARVHPDRFADQGAPQQRIAVQTAAFVNEAYQCLKNPLRRAQYLLVLAGHAIHSDTHTHQDHAFLLEQMQLREELERVSQQTDPAALDTLLDHIRVRTAQLQAAFVQAFIAKDYTQAMDSVLKWQFLVKLQADAHRLAEHFDQD